MKYPGFKILFILLLVASQGAHATARNYIKDKDVFIEKYLKQSTYSIDTSAEAVVLYEKYEDDISGSQFNTYKVRRIIKIVKQGGIHNADVDINEYTSKDFYSQIKKISATAYNLENGKVTAQKLDGDDIFKGTFDHINEKKFTIPSVRAGSVIEYTFEVERESTYKFAKWNIQGSLPKLYSELEIIYPRDYEIISIDHNVEVFQKADFDDEESTLPDAYMYSESYTADVINNHWIRKNVPAFGDEPFVDNINKYLEVRELFIKGFYMADGPADEHYNTWAKINDYLLKSPKFFKNISGNTVVTDKAHALTGNERDKLEQAKIIFAYVQDSITAQESDLIEVKNHPAAVLKNGTGTQTEVNTLLIAMLRGIDVECDPVILSTKNNGVVTNIYPDLNTFNYTVCRAVIGDQKYYLDASGRYNPFGVLPEACYNGYARLISKKGDSVMLLHNAANERGLFKLVTDNSTIDNYTVTASLYFGQFESIRCREQWSSDSTEIKKTVTSLLKFMPEGTRLKKYNVEHLYELDKTLALNFTFTMAWPADADKIYFSPFFYTFYNSNPFVSSTRKYPVEMPYTLNFTYYCQLQLPEGYTMADSLAPFSMRFDDYATYNAVFNYDKNNNILTVNDNTHIFKTQFLVSEYAGLKEFFDKMLEEQQNNLVIKKL